MNTLRRNECASIFAVRSRMIKTKHNYKSMHKDTQCRWCPATIESIQHIINGCPHFKEHTKNINYNTIMTEDNEPLQKEAQQIKAITKIINQHTTWRRSNERATWPSRTTSPPRSMKLRLLIPQYSGWYRALWTLHELINTVLQWYERKISVIYSCYSCLCKFHMLSGMPRIWILFVLYMYLNWHVHWLFINITDILHARVSKTLYCVFWDLLWLVFCKQIQYCNWSSHYHPLKCVQWPVLLGGALGRMFGGSSNFLLTFDSKSMYIGYVLTISWLN